MFHSATSYCDEPTHCNLLTATPAGVAHRHTQVKDAKVQHAQNGSRRDSSALLQQESVLFHRNTLLEERLAETRAETEALRLEYEAVQQEAATLRRRLQQAEDRREDDAQELLQVTRALQTQTQLAKQRGVTVSELEEACEQAEQAAQTLRLQLADGQQRASTVVQTDEAAAMQLQKTTAAVAAALEKEVARLSGDITHLSQALEAAEAVMLADRTRLTAAVESAEERAESVCSSALTKQTLCTHLPASPLSVALLYAPA